MKSFWKHAAAVCAISLLAACGGGGGGTSDSTLGVASDTTVGVNSTAAAALLNTTFSFPTGVAALGTTGSTTVAFTSGGTTPGFRIASGGSEATGTTTFGSCIFVVTASNFTAGHALALGQTVSVNPCNLSVATAGARANGVATTRSVALALGAAVSSGQSISVGVTAGGQLTLNGVQVATVTLTPVSDSTGGTGGTGSTTR